MHKAIQNALKIGTRKAMADWKAERRVLADAAVRHEHQGRTIEAHATRTQANALAASMERKAS